MADDPISVARTVRSVLHKCPEIKYDQLSRTLRDVKETLRDYPELCRKMDEPTHVDDPRTDITDFAPCTVDEFAHWFVLFAGVWEDYLDSIKKHGKPRFYIEAYVMNVILQFPHFRRKSDGQLLYKEFIANVIGYIYFNVMDIISRTPGLSTQYLGVIAELKKQVEQPEQSQ